MMSSRREHSRHPSRASSRHTSGTSHLSGHTSSAHYDPYLDGLFTYCLSVMCQHDMAIAALGEALGLAERRRERGRRPAQRELHRPWLYALARWACLRRLADPPGRRGEAGAALSRAAATQRRRELAALAWPEAVGTTPEQREALELAVRHQLSAAEIAAVIGTGNEAVLTLLSSAACEVERARAALAVVESGDCPALAHLGGARRGAGNTSGRRGLGGTGRNSHGSHASPAGYAGPTGYAGPAGHGAPAEDSSLSHYGSHSAFGNYGYGHSNRSDSDHADLGYYGSHGSHGSQGNHGRNGGTRGAPGERRNPEVLLGTALRRELLCHIDQCADCRRAAEHALAAGSRPGVAPAGPAVLTVLEAPRPSVHAAMLSALRARAQRAPRFDRRGFPIDPRDRSARRARLRSRAVTTTVITTVLAAPVLAVWAAYRQAPLTHEAPGAGPLSAAGAGDADTAADLGYPYASTRPNGPNGLGGHPSQTAGSALRTPSAEPGREADGSRGTGSLQPNRGAGKTLPGQRIRERPAAGRLTVDAQSDGNGTLITLSASGGSPVDWSASADAEWLRLSDTAGTLRPGESVTVTVTVDGAREPQGPWSARIRIAPAGSVITVQGQGSGASAPSGQPSADHPSSGPSNPSSPSAPSEPSGPSEPSEGPENSPLSEPLATSEPSAAENRVRSGKPSSSGASGSRSAGTEPI